MFFLILICIVNIGVFIYAQNLNHTITPRAYQKLESRLEQIPNEQRYEFVKSEYEKYHAFTIIEQLDTLRINPKENQYMIDILSNEYPHIEEQYRQVYENNHHFYYTDNLESDAEFLKQMMNEFEILHEYPQYIENIQNQAKTISSISIFQNNADSFEQKNILRSAEDYQKAISIPLTYMSEKGIHAALSFPLTSFFIMISMMVLASTMIIEEKEKRLFSIIKLTQKGQYPTMIAKGIVLMSLVGMMTFMMVSSQLLYSSITYGLGDLTRSLQSLASFSHCPFSLNVYQFIIVFMLVKWLAACLVGFLMMLMAIMARNKIFALLSISIIVIIEYIFYLFIPSLNSFYLLKYLNIMSVLQTDVFFQIYRNVNIMGEPVSLHLITCILMSFLMICLFLVTCITYSRKKNMNIQTFELKIPSFSFPLSLSLRGQEFYKILHIQKVLILCLLCIGIQIYQYHDMSLYIDTDTKMKQQYMKELEGPLTESKEQWLLQEKEHYTELNQQLEQISQKKSEGKITQFQAIQMSEPIEQQLIGEEVFQKIYEQYLDIKENTQKQFVFDEAYQQFFMGTSWTMMPTILLCIMLILGFSSFINYEYQNEMYRVTQTTLKGNKVLLHTKLQIIALMSLVFFIIINLPPLILLHQTYGFSSLSASLISIEGLAEFPSWMSIGIACLLSFLLRFFAVLCLAFGIQAIAVKTRNQIITLFMSLFVFLVPLLLAYGGFDLLNGISLYPLLFHGQLIGTTGGLFQILFSITGYSILLFLSLKYIYHNYKQQNI